MSERSWEVEPGSGVDPLRFGTPRAELQALLGPHRAFRRSPTSDLADQHLMPAYPLTIEDVRPLLAGAGHPLIELEAGIEIADAGVQVLTMRPSPSSDGPLPVACVAISARTASVRRADQLDAAATVPPSGCA
ncbi:hypothetical protein ACFPIJ_50915 [Dactylosporangium cerinum]|uniref:Uncharacterized protein n=1 Tax=Dactylosporangium cerinum TaxID=1434730 RepID=A0ABV9WCF0_9ACTN